MSEVHLMGQPRVTGRKPVSLQFVQPTEEQKALMQEYRDAIEAVYKKVEELPQGRGRSIALTKIEEAAMWVNKRITEND